MLLRCEEHTKESEEWLQPNRRNRFSSVPYGTAVNRYACGTSADAAVRAHDLLRKSCNMLVAMRLWATPVPIPNTMVKA